MRSEEAGNPLRNVLTKAGVECDDALCGRLERFSQLLREWNATHNLTGDDRPEAIVANLVDSLRPLGFVERPASLLDVGTGAGFPGLILAAAWPGTRCVLCEPRQKRAAFLRFAALEMELENVEVARKRVEELPDDSFELISSRAVGDVESLLELTRHLSGEKSRYLFYKGSELDQELSRVPKGLEAIVEEHPPRRYLYLVPKESGKRDIISEKSERKERNETHGSGSGTLS